MEGRIFSSPLVFRQRKSHKMPQKHLLERVVDDDQMLHNRTLVFNVEEALLIKSSMFSYFMLVAIEDGGFIRGLILLLMYPFICILGKEMGLKLMVFICFFGVKKETFRIGRSVLPKFFMENVGCEGLEVVMKFDKKVGVTNLPRVMVEGFLVDYLGVEDIVGRDIKVFGGYYLGLMDNKHGGQHVHNDAFASVNSQAIGVGGSPKSFETYPFIFCKDLYMVSEADKKNWHHLPREKYPRPLIFHDGRLAFTPTPSNTLAMFMWLPFGIILCLIRITIALLLPFQISTPILAFIGISYSSSSNLPNSSTTKKNDQYDKEETKGIVYVCNHRTVLDPLYVSYICRMKLTALTYSISKTTKLLSPIKTITLTRDRQKDAEIMQKVYNQGNVILFPEGTTCREPYLLRFSPMFAEISDDIVPLAIQVHVSMFHGTTASGIKALDPFFYMLNPWPYAHVSFLDKLPKYRTCGGGGLSKFDVANSVQAEIGRALGYKCTDLRRKDKYLILAGNTGVVTESK